MDPSRDLYADLRAFQADVSDAAATALAAAGDRAALPAVLQAMRDDAAWEYVSHPKAAAVARLARPEDGLQFIDALDALRDEDLEDDPGDGIDSYWRLRQAFEEVLVAMGARARPAIEKGVASDNPETRARVQAARDRLFASGVIPPEAGSLEGAIAEGRAGRLPLDDFLAVFVRSPIHVALRSAPEADGSNFRPVVVEGAGGRTFVATFTSPEHVRSSGLRPPYVLLLPNAAYLLARMAGAPHGVVVNPGQTVGLELSPGEVARLAGRVASPGA